MQVHIRVTIRLTNTSNHCELATFTSICNETYCNMYMYINFIFVIMVVVAFIRTVLHQTKSVCG